MANARRIIWVMAVVLSVASLPVLGRIDFADGGTYDIEYVIDNEVWVDHMAPGMQTTVNLLHGGTITMDLVGFKNSRLNILGGSTGEDVCTYENSRVNISAGWIFGYLHANDSSQVGISGGSIGHYLTASDSSHVDISGGSIGHDLNTRGSSQVDIYGGSIGHDLDARGNSQVDIYGGYIDNSLYLTESAILTIQGSDFAVDLVPFDYGELTSIRGGNMYDEPYRNLTGTLASGEPINNGFYIGHDAKIALIPAPPPANHPPVADAGPDQTVEQESYDGTEVTLDGSGSTDPDSKPVTNDDIIGFEWYEGGSVFGSGETINYTFPLGPHTITLVVTDSFGETDDDEVTIDVIDTTLPEITCPADVTVEQESYDGTVVPLEATATDICDPNPVITSDELAIYPLGETVVTFTATDASGNSVSCSMTVTVVDTHTTDHHLY